MRVYNLDVYWWMYLYFFFVFANNNYSDYSNYSENYTEWHVLNASFQMSDMPRVCMQSKHFLQTGRIFDGGACLWTFCICIQTSVFVFEHLYLYLNVHWRAGAAYCERLWCLTLFLSEPLTFPACRWTRYTRVMNALAKVYLYLYFLFVFAIKRRLFLSEAPLYFLPMDQWYMMMCVLAQDTRRHVPLVNGQKM